MPVVVVVVVVVVLAVLVTWSRSEFNNAREIHNEFKSQQWNIP